MPVAALRLTLSAPGECVTACSHSGFTPEVKHYSFSLFPAVCLDKAEANLGWVVIVFLSPDIRVALSTSGK